MSIDKRSFAPLIKWWAWFLRLLVAFRAVIARGCFIIYAFLAVGTLVYVRQSKLFWLLLLTILPLTVELLLELHHIVNRREKKKRKKPKWFSPAILLFLFCACPPIWLAEIALYSQSTSSPHYSINVTVDQHVMTKRSMESESKSPVGNITQIYSLHENVRKSMVVAISSTKAKEMVVDIDKERERQVTTANALLPHVFKSVIDMSEEQKVRVLEQMLLLCLICGRWLLPRGGITRDQLSQLLLVNIGMAADILELFEAFKEEVVRKNQMLVIIILTLWQASLIQFSLTKTATKARKIRPGFLNTMEHVSVNGSIKDEANVKEGMSGCLFCETEMWAICTSLMLQDVPFLAMRMTLIFHFEVLSYSNVFFTCKNSLVILLQLFRIFVILTEPDEGLAANPSWAMSHQQLGSSDQLNKPQNQEIYEKELFCTLRKPQSQPLSPIALDKPRVYRSQMNLYAPSFSTRPPRTFSSVLDGEERSLNRQESLPDRMTNSLMTPAFHNPAPRYVWKCARRSNDSFVHQGDSVRKPPIISVTSENEQVKEGDRLVDEDPYPQDNPSDEMKRLRIFPLISPRPHPTHSMSLPACNIQKRNSGMKKSQTFSIVQQPNFLSQQHVDVP